MWAKGETIIQWIDNYAPKKLALPDDKIGLQVGRLNKEVRKIMLTLDVLDNVVDEAIEQNVNLIISHHPIIYRPLKDLRTDTIYGKIYEKLIQHNITVYVIHSNLDVTAEGVSEVLARKLGLIDMTIMDVTYEEKLKKLVVFVPETHYEGLFRALTEAGAGAIGNYSHCTFNTKGTGTFMPHSGTKPFIGLQGKLEEVAEIRLETIFPAEKQTKVLKAMLNAHPYEEVAYDIYQVEQAGKVYGLGKIGYLESEITLREYVEFVKRTFELKGVRVVGDLNKKIKKVVVLGGDGNSFIKKAIFHGADLYITGDIYYHDAHEALMAGLAIIDVGHYVEKFVFASLKNYLDTKIKENKYQTEVVISKVNTNPFNFM